MPLRACIHRRPRPRAWHDPTPLDSPRLDSTPLPSPPLPSTPLHSTLHFPPWEPFSCPQICVARIPPPFKWSGGGPSCVTRLATPPSSPNGLRGATAPTRNHERCSIGTTECCDHDTGPRRRSVPTLAAPDQTLHPRWAAARRGCMTGVARRMHQTDLWGCWARCLAMAVCTLRAPLNARSVRPLALHAV